MKPTMETVLSELLKVVDTFRGRTFSVEYQDELKSALVNKALEIGVDKVLAQELANELEQFNRAFNDHFFGNFN